MAFGQSIVWFFCVMVHATVKEHLGIWSVLGTWPEGMEILTLHGLSISISYKLPPPLSPICLALPLFPTSLKRPSICRAVHQSVTGPGVRSHEFWFTPGSRLRCHLASLCPSFLICKVRKLSWMILDIPFLSKQHLLHITQASRYILCLERAARLNIERI